MNTTIFFDIASLYLGIILLWIGLNWLYRDLATDYFRQKMFRLRDSLFDEAADGLISFDHPAYTTLRKMMNGFLRFGHKTSLLSLIIHLAITRDFSGGQELERYWRKITKDLDENLQDKLEGYRERMGLLVVVQSIISSPLIFALIIVPSVALIIPALILWHMKNRIFDCIAKRLENEINSVESTALIYGSAIN